MAGSDAGLEAVETRFPKHHAEQAGILATGLPPSTAVVSRQWAVERYPIMLARMRDACFRHARA
jgi:hypothetical protein